MMSMIFFSVFDKSNKSSSFKENNQKYTDKGYSDNDRNNPSQNGILKTYIFFFF